MVIHYQMGFVMALVLVRIIFQELIFQISVQFYLSLLWFRSGLDDLIEGGGDLSRKKTRTPLYRMYLKLAAVELQTNHAFSIFAADGWVSYYTYCTYWFPYPKSGLIHLHCKSVGFRAACCGFTAVFGLRFWAALQSDSLCIPRMCWNRMA